MKVWPASLATTGSCPVERKPDTSSLQSAVRVINNCASGKTGEQREAVRMVAEVKTSCLVLAVIVMLVS